MSLFSIARQQSFHTHLHGPADDGDVDATNVSPQRSDHTDTDPSSSNQQVQNGSCSPEDTNNANTSNKPRRRRRIISTRTATIDKATTYTRPGRPKHAAFLELLYGLILYTTCIFLPSFPRYIFQTYIWISAWMNVIRERFIWSIWICYRFTVIILERWGYMDSPFKAKNQTIEDEEEMKTQGLRRFGRRIGRFIFSQSTQGLWEEFSQQHGQDGSSSSSSATSPYTWGFGRSSSAFPAILMVIQDIQILLLCAMLLAMLRIWMVHMLVPEYLAPRRLEALTRCKSSHLLSSSSYSFGGVKGWDRATEKVVKRRDNLSGRYSVVNLSSLGEESGEGQNESNKVAGWYERMLIWVSYYWHRLRPSVRRALGHEPSARYDMVQQQQPSSSPFRRSNSTPNPTQMLFSAPRHATAMFRLLYTSISCISALVLFQSAEFWPRSLFGTHAHASTRHCWDLSGSFSALGFLDDDYDALNGALKYFFLAQASYQLHSLCFHIVSMLLLMFYGGGGAVANASNDSSSWIGRIAGRLRGKKKNQRHDPFQVPTEQQQNHLISMKTSMQSYVRPMCEHVIVLALLVGAYLFSGLRRLGAVGIFTLELSSVFLQLLQVSIYAPEKSWLGKPEVVVFVHRCLTIPTFVYCRLIVLPFVLWRSALFESQEWLEQIEKVFSPGWGERLYTMFSWSLCLIFALNLVLFRRLLFHPHIQMVKQQKDRL